MAAGKKSFVLYTSWIDQIELLTNDQAGRLFMAILTFSNGKKVVVEDDIKELFVAIKRQIKYEWSKFNPKTEKYHWNYKGGITPKNKALRASAEYGYWRTLVFERDDYTCQECGTRGGTLHAHHVKPFAVYPKLRLEVSNGKTLCEDCHNQVHRKEVVNG